MSSLDYVRKANNVSYIGYGLVILVMMTLCGARGGNSIALIGDPTIKIAIWITMLVIAGVGVAILLGTSRIKGTFMHSKAGSYFKYALLLVMVVIITLVGISLSKYEIIIALFFQEKNMFK